MGGNWLVRKDAMDYCWQKFEIQKARQQTRFVVAAVRTP